MKNFNYLILLLFLGNSFVITAQNGKQKKADKLYNDLAFFEAVEVYKDLIDNDYNVVYNKQKLGDSYFKLRSPENAVHYYGDVINEAGISPEYYYKYAQALRGVKRYDESREWLKKYLESGGQSGDVKKMLDQNIAQFEIADEYVLEKSAFNSELSDFGAYEHNGITYFVSARDAGMSKKNKVYTWNNEPFLDVYQLNGGMAVPVAGDVNTVLHDGPIAITSDGKYMYFNRNNYINKREGKRDKSATNHLKIYRATNNNGQWEDVVELPFNNNSYSVGHPALSSDGKTLYFASDMPGGMGGSDLYKVDILGDNQYGNPVNLGNKINTSFEESFPFVNKENVLYFSSNGHLGLGLLDVFKMDLSKPGTEVKNLGAPVNSNLDDFAYFQKGENNTGFLASNREGASDNIYNFNKLNPLVLKGQVTDRINNRPVGNATVRLFNENNEQIAFLETDQSGNYTTQIARDKNFPVEAKHIEYVEETGTISSFNTNDKEELIYNIQLSPVEDIEYLAEIDIIYFDFDKANIRPDAAKELDKLVDLMQNKYPELVINIGSHTDARGSDRYNEGLAQRRAKSTYDYIISKGVNPDRIQTYQGFGEKQPAVDCERCKETEHQLNRRSIFSVVKMN